MEVRSGAIRVKFKALARCPVCRAEMTFAHRQQDGTRFFLIGGSQTLLELGTVSSRDKAVQLTTKSYKRTQSMTL